MSEPFQTAIKRGAKRWLRRRYQPLRRATHNLRLEQRIRKINLAAKPYFERLHAASNLKVHLGCGPDVRTGWVNVDLNTRRTAPAFEEKPGSTIYINYDLRQGLPLKSGSCACVYSSHFFEHLEFDCGVKLMEDCFDALQKGGTFRIVLPDLKTIFKAYLERDAAYFDLLDPLLASEIEPKTATLIDYVNYGIYQFGEHKYIYDEEKLIKVLKSIGYRDVHASAFASGLDVDTPTRRRYSFYVDAKK